jgi:hypothetical protein
MVRVKEKYFKTKYRTSGILHNVNSMTYFKFKLQLKFRNNKNYSALIVNFHLGLQEKIHQLKIKVYEEHKLSKEEYQSLGHYHLFLFLTIKQCLTNVISFRLSKSLHSQSIPFKHTSNCGSAFPNNLDCRICDTKYPKHIRFLFSIFYFSYHFNFTFKTQNLTFIGRCSHVITLPISPQVEKYENGRHLDTQSELLLLFQALNLYSYLKVEKVCPFKDEDMVEFSI